MFGKSLSNSSGLIKGSRQEQAFLDEDMVFRGAITATTQGGCDDESEEMSRLGVNGINYKKSRKLSGKNNLI